MISTSKEPNYFLTSKVAFFFEMVKRETIELSGITWCPHTHFKFQGDKRKMPQILL